MEFNIALIKGDGIGPEISLEAVKVLEETGKIFRHNFNITFVAAAGEAVDMFNNPLPEGSIASCIKSDAILFANLGGSKWANNPIEKMPEKSLIELRKIINTTINIRPIDLSAELAEFSPLKHGIIGMGMNSVVVRDIIGGMINGEKRRCSCSHGKEASDLEYYNEEIVREVAEYGFKLARNRNRYVVSLDKANVLASSKLWRETVDEAAKKYPDVRVEHILVDNAAMEVLKRPGDFDVIVTSAMFGDIIADELSQITGIASNLASIEMSPSGKGIYTPNQLHYPDESIIGLNKANPIGFIKAAACMLRYSLGLSDEADAVERSINHVISLGYATEDFCTEGRTKVTTSEMGDLIKKYLNL